MTAAEQVARALRRIECISIDCEPCRSLQQCPTVTALADFVEAADHLRNAHRTMLTLTGEDHNALGGSAYDAALKRLAEVLR